MRFSIFHGLLFQRSRTTQNAIPRPSLSMFMSTRTNMDSDYEFLDCGNYQRFERFGTNYVIRSCPSAPWRPGLPFWQNSEAIVYKGESGKTGEWVGLNPMDDQWNVTIGNSWKFCLRASEQGQIGMFPEQVDNWIWIADLLSRRSTMKKSSSYQDDPIKVLNGFAYTGGSTLAAASVAGVEVVHLDAAKSFVQWAMKNALASKLDDRPVKWIVDDCATYLDREVIKRHNKYDGLIFDPPAFGRGGKGRVWKIEKDLPLLAQRFQHLLSDNPRFVLLSCHDPAWPADRLAELLERHTPQYGVISSGELTLSPKVGGDGVLGTKPVGRSLPLGVYARWQASP